MDVRKSKRKLSKFKSSIFDLADSYRSGKSTIVDNDVLRTKWKQIYVRQMKNCQTSLTTLGRMAEEYLQQIRKVSRASVWVSHRSEENKINGTIQNPLLIYRSLDPI